MGAGLYDLAARNVCSLLLLAGHNPKQSIADGRVT